MSKKNEQQQSNNPFHSPQWLGKRLSMARESLGITPEELAKLMKTSSYTIARVEQGKKTLPCGWVYKLSHFLGIDANWLLDGMKAGTQNKKTLYEELFNLMQVPEIATIINCQLQFSKVIFKGEIKETLLKRKKISPRTNTDGPDDTGKSVIDYTD